MRPRLKAYLTALLLICSAANAQEGANPAPEPTPEPMRIIGPAEVEAGDLVILTADVPAEADVDWAITPPEAVAKLYIDTTGRTAVFATRAEGEYVFSLAVAHEGMATCVVHVLKNGNGPKPDPEPEPEPDPEPEPEPTPGKRFVLVVMESEGRTPQQAAVLMAMRQYLQSKGHEFRFVDPDITDKDGKPPAWFQGYQSDLDKVSGTEKTCGPNGCTTRLAQPVLIIGVLEADRTVSKRWAEVLPSTPEAAIEAVQRRGG